MNKEWEEAGRKLLLDSVKKCTDAQQEVFKRIYAHKNPEFSIEEVVNNIDNERMNSALDIVERTLAKNQNNEKN